VSQIALLQAAAEVLACLDEAGAPSCVIGGLAVARWGVPRATGDVDLTVLAPHGQESAVLDLLLGQFPARRPDARAFALVNRVVLLRTATGPEADVSLAALPFELEALDLASSWEAATGVFLRTCPAEHLIVYKLVAARPQDLVDVEGIVRRQGDRLDVGRIRRWGREFAELKEDPDLLRPFEDALRKAQAK
jgi:hypothetical protein